MLLCKRLPCRLKSKNERTCSTAGAFLRLERGTLISKNKDALPHPKILRGAALFFVILERSEES